jgi:hypothetical protein
MSFKDYNYEASLLWMRDNIDNFILCQDRIQKMEYIKVFNKLFDVSKNKVINIINKNKELNIIYEFWVKEMSEFYANEERKNKSYYDDIDLTPNQLAMKCEGCLLNWGDCICDFHYDLEK